MNLHAQVFEDRLDLDIELLEAVPLSPLSSVEELASYPFPRLRPTSQSRRVSFQALVLENNYARYVILPDLGGRIYAAYDKRTQKDLIESGIILHNGGPRGVTLLQGIEFEFGGPRLDALGPVRWQIDEESEEASLVMRGQEGALTWHLVLALMPDSAALRLEGRVFNDSWSTASYNVRLNRNGAKLEVAGRTGAWFEDRRFPEPRLLAPRQLDTWGICLVPWSLDGVPVAASEAGVLSIDPQIAIQAAHPIRGRAFLLLDTGQTLEAALDLLPETPFIADLPGQIQAVTVRDEGGQDLLSWTDSAPLSPSWPAFTPPDLEAISESVFADQPNAQALADAEFDIRTKSAARELLAISSLRTGNLESAAAQIDDALNYAAESPPLWVMKALIARKTGVETDDLLNAHYLAPLDPLLRMEGFLAQNHQTKETNPLIAAIADDPDALTGCACFLYDLGQYDDLARWVDECLRHREIPMLRYILATALLDRSPMSVDAGNHIARAASTPINPPYPWRPTEMRILRRLAARFPEDARLADLLSLIQAAGNKIAADHD